ncbi:hypothetical protein SLOPH_965 [Spraguea lophii 42_110]|uniref:Uncharacterized protein n=1 Tax=Spraguea lophii (strain 42_110) TaxID=1358809 RepID=S7XIR6_SPRLO|nr:hypothetical protein SLOPH_965 [Spraguea lophii 42_110]
MRFSLRNVLLIIVGSTVILTLFAVLFIYIRDGGFDGKEQKRRLSRFLDDQEKCGVLLKNKKYVVKILMSFYSRALKNEILEAEKKGERLNDECIKKLKNLDIAAVNINMLMKRRHW